MQKINIKAIKLLKFIYNFITKRRPKKRWMDCENDDMRIKGVGMEMTSDRREWKRKTCFADPT
jgi:hypothetical protein